VPVTTLVICSRVNSPVELSDYSLLRKSYELFNTRPTKWFLQTEAHIGDGLVDDAQTTVAKSELSASTVLDPSKHASLERIQNCMKQSWSIGTDLVLYVSPDLIFSGPVDCVDLARRNRILVDAPFESRVEENYACFVFCGSQLSFDRWLSGDETPLRLEPSLFFTRSTTPRENGVLPPSIVRSSVNIRLTTDDPHAVQAKYDVLDALDQLALRDEGKNCALRSLLAGSGDGQFFEFLGKRRVGIATHCDPARAVRLLLLAESVPRQVPIVCAVNGTFQELQERLGCSMLPNNVRIVPQPPRDPFPTNALRNVAMQESQSDFVFFTDVDFVFQRAFWYLLITNYAELMSNERVCLCPIPLCDYDASYVHGKPKEEMISSEQASDHAYPAQWSETNRAGLFKYHDRWFGDKWRSTGQHEFEITDVLARLRSSAHPGEPWGLLRRSDAPCADEAFTGRMMDKQQFVAALLDRGFRFYVLPSLFVFHLWHPRRSDVAAFKGTGPAFDLWIRKYHAKRHRYLHLRFLSEQEILPFRRAIVGTIRSFKPAAQEMVLSNIENSDSCLPFLRARVDYIEVPIAFSEEFLGFGYRIFTVVSSRRKLSSRGHTRQNEERIVEHFGGKGHDLARGVLNARHFAFVLDSSDPVMCERALSDILGSTIQFSPVGEDSAYTSKVPMSSQNKFLDILKKHKLCP
jgi:hypothetical protein